jgi:hydrogenase nickel incorporation protein HypB
MKIDVKRAVYEENDAIAREIHDGLQARGVFTVNVLGSPGSGKTSLITHLARCLGADSPFAVIEGDVASDLDTRRLREFGIDAYQIETGGDCHLNAPMIRAVLGKMPVPDRSWLFIENIGNLVCPAEFVIGEDIKIVVASVAEGADKPHKYPAAFARSAACALTKIDLAEAVGFDADFFRSGLASVAPGAALFPMNARSGEGVEAFAKYLAEVRAHLSH